MNRSQLYQRAKVLAVETGQPLGGIWRTGTTEFWRNRVKILNRDINKRQRNHRKAVELADNLNELLSIPATLRGTNNKIWVRELQRLRMKARRAIIRGQRQTRQQALPLLAAIQRRRETAPERQRQQQRTRILQGEIQRQVERRSTERMFNGLIEQNDFQQILNLVIAGDGRTLTLRQATRFLNKVRRAGRHISNIISNLGLTTVTINPNTRDFFLSILQHGLIIQEGADRFGSDLLSDINIQSIRGMTIERYQTPQRIIENRDGRFFPYLNTSKLDLIKYQIFNQEQAYNDKLIKEREQCLIFSLLQNNVKKALCNEVKLAYINGSSIRKKDIQSIADMIDRIIIIHSLNPDGHLKKIIQKPNSKDSKADKKDPVEIAIHSNHYFKFEDTQYTTYSIKNYDMVKDEPDFKNIVKKRKNGKYRNIKDDDKSRRINSLRLVDELHKQKKFKKLDMSRFEEAASHQELRDHIYLGNIQDEQRECKPSKNIKKIPQNIYYADCESFVHKGVENHQLYLLGVVSRKSDSVDILNICDEVYQNGKVNKTQLLVFEFLKIVTLNGRQNAQVYFHNLKYDFHLLEKYLNVKEVCIKDNQIFSVDIIYKKMKVQLRDSYKLIPFALSKFQKEFNLPRKLGKKEAIAYTYYTEANNDEIIKCSDYCELLSKSEQEIFKTQIIRERAYYPETKTFNPLEYYKEYLKLDCLVLKHGLEKFENLIGEITENKMSVYDSLTICSLTDSYMRVKGCYDDIYEIKGNLRAYVASSVYGGRVCVNEKYKKKIILGKIADYDGVSLYPSAINRLCREKGLSKGPAKRFNKENLNTWKDKHYAVITVKITKVNKNQQMPFIANKSESSIKYINELPRDLNGDIKPVTIDQITLEDLIKFHKIEYELLEGVYWDEGGNKKMGTEMKNLFNSRLKYKKTNPALANAIKLMLNSTYGKSITSKTKTEIKIKSAKRTKFNKKTKKTEVIEEFHNYVYNNFNTIKNYRKINDINGGTYQIERTSADKSYNRGHIGCAILSMSKRIMNEVFDIANTNKYPIYYTDTDSMHLNAEDVPKLEAKYKEIYNKELNGKNLEQFHTDFNLNGADGEIYSTKSIFLGKKSYFDKLECINKDGTKITGSHIRLKGITIEGMIHQAKKYDKKNLHAGYEKLYMDLAKGTKIQMTLNPFNPDENKNKVLFEFKKGNVSTKTEFKRRVQF